MATINGKSNHWQQGTWRSIWPLMGGADAGTPDQLSRYPLHSVQFGAVDPLISPPPAAGVGTSFGGATAILEGSEDGITYFAMKDVFGNAISTTAAARFDFEGVAYHVRPRTSGGTNSSLTVIVTSHPQS